MPENQSKLRFSAKLLRPVAPKGARWAFLILPATISAQLPSRGLVSVEGTLAAQVFQATLQPDGQGSHWLKVPGPLAAAAGVQAGDEVAIELAPMAEVPEPRVPADLRQALAASAAARTQWKKITPAARRDFIFWLDTAKQAPTRARRIANGCDMLACGKRRVCCFDASGIYGNGIAAPQAMPARE